MTLAMAKMPKSDIPIMIAAESKMATREIFLGIPEHRVHGWQTFPFHIG
jgi:hypothetical protein